MTGDAPARGNNSPTAAGGALQAQTVDVWCVDLGGARISAIDDLAVLSGDERERADRFEFAHDRRDFIVGRAALRRILAHYTRAPPRDIAFAYGEFGKPALAGHASLSFNCSHSADLYLCAVCDDAAVGIDVERVRPIDRLLELAETHFASTEVAALRRLDPAARTNAFFMCWTRKEAYIKATGAGLSATLDQFSVSLEPGAAARLLTCADTPAHVQTFSLCALAARPGYIASLALDGSVRQISYRHYEPSELAQIPAAPAGS